MIQQRHYDCSFICSSNNNISRITKMVQNLCLHYSQPLLSLPHPFSPNETLAYHPFPTPSALAGSGVGLHLRTLGFGYRADYIHRTAKMLVETHGVGTSASPFGTQEAPEIWLERLRKKTTEEAREELLKFIGVGRKVADCILLMSLDKVSALVRSYYYFLPWHTFSAKSSQWTPTFIRLHWSITVWNPLAKGRLPWPRSFMKRFTPSSLQFGGIMQVGLIRYVARPFNILIGADCIPGPIYCRFKIILRLWSTCQCITQPCQGRPSSEREIQTLYAAP